MGRFYNRKHLGLMTNGCAQSGTNEGFTTFAYRAGDSMSGSGCFHMDNVLARGATALSDDFIPVDPVNKTYQFGLSVKTLTPNYLGNNGSGHLGFGCFDKDKVFIQSYQSWSTENTTLTRACSAGDTSVYIGRGDWYVGTTSHARTINFYPAAHPDWNTVGGYTRYSILYGYIENGVVDVGGGEFRVDLTNPLPSGYDFPIGTDVGRATAGGSYNYALGAPVYPTEWTTYITGAMTGYLYNALSSGAEFRPETKYIKFLNLRNYNYRTQTAGDAATYLLDNIILVECPNGTAYPTSLFARSNTGGM